MLIEAEGSVWRSLERRFKLVVPLRLDANTDRNRSAISACIYFFVFSLLLLFLTVTRPLISVAYFQWATCIVFVFLKASSLALIRKCLDQLSFLILNSLVYC